MSLVTAHGRAWAVHLRGCDQCREAMTPTGYQQLPKGVRLRRDLRAYRDRKGLPGYTGAHCGSGWALRVESVLENRALAAE